MEVKHLSAKIEVGYGDNFENFALELIALAEQTRVSVTAEWPSYGNFIKITTASPTSTLDDLKSQKHGGKTS